MALKFDLDGVLRYLGFMPGEDEPASWYEKKDGMSVIDRVNADPGICERAPPTEYLKVVNERMSDLTILTNQLPKWIPYTEKWLARHVEIPYEVIYTDGPREKMSMLKRGDIICEDYPLFDSYDQVALVTRRYNAHLEVPCRINEPQDLALLIDKCGAGDGFKQWLRHGHDIMTISRSEYDHLYEVYNEWLGDQ